MLTYFFVFLGGFIIGITTILVSSIIYSNRFYSKDSWS